VIVGESVGLALIVGAGLIVGTVEGKALDDGMEVRGMFVGITLGGSLITDGC
jgi:hypothetical protein